MKVFTTGIGSGLGRYVHECFAGPGLDRSSHVEDFADNGPMDAIVHCAFNTRRGATNWNLHDGFDDNLLLTRRLTRLPAAKFIYISTVDVYPKDGALHEEGETIEMLTHNYFYGITKLFAESIVRKHCRNNLILRIGLPLGPYARKTNPVKVLTEPDPILTLNRVSTYNCIRSSDLIAFIRMAIERDLTGIFNVVSNTTITLGEMAHRAGREVVFGAYSYHCGHISNKKINGICDTFNASSEKVVDQYLAENQTKRN